MSRSLDRAFSLLEVAIAVALVAVTVVSILALVAALARRTAEARERRTAIGLADAIAVELRRQVATEGWPAVADRAAAGEDPALRLVASRAGEEVRPWRNSGPASIDQFFLIEVRRFVDGPLALPASGPVLPLGITIAWPYRPGTPAGLARESTAADRSRFEYATVISR